MATLAMYYKPFFVILNIRGARFYSRMPRTAAVALLAMATLGDETVSDS